MISSHTLPYTSNFFRILLVLGGIFPNHKYRIFFETALSLTQCVISLFAFMGPIVVLVHMRTIEITSVSIFTLSAIIFSFCLHWLIKLCRDILSTFIDNVLQIPPDFVGRDATSTAELIFKNIIIKVVTIFGVLFSSMICISIFGPILFDIDYGNPNHYLTPRWYMCTNPEKKIFGISCQEVKTYAKYVTLNLLAMFCWIEHQSIGSTCLLFIFYVLEYLKAHAEIIRSRLGEIGAEIENENNGRQTRKFDKILLYEQKLQRDLIEIMKYYQYLLKTWNGVSSCLSVLASAYLINAFVTALFAIFTTVNVTQNSAKGYLIIYSGSVSTMYLAQFFCICYCAEKIKELNEKIANAVYHMPWYYCSTSFKKDVRRFLLILKKPMQISCLGVFEPNFQFLTKLIRILYSCLNLMMATVKEA